MGVAEGVAEVVTVYVAELTAAAVPVDGLVVVCHAPCCPKFADSALYCCC